MHVSTKFAALAVLVPVCACGANKFDLTAPVGNANAPASSQGNPNAPASTPAATDSSSGLRQESQAAGTVSGHAFAPHSSASANFAADYNALLLVVSNQTDYCGALEAGQTHANHLALVVQLLREQGDNDTGRVTPGTYKVVPSDQEPAGNVALALFRATDASCNDTMTQDEAQASSGAVVVTASTAQGATGSYNLTFPDGTLRGTFAANACPVLAQQAASPSPLSCEP